MINKPSEDLMVLAFTAGDVNYHIHRFIRMVAIKGEEDRQRLEIAHAAAVQAVEQLVWALKHNAPK